MTSKSVIQLTNVTKNFDHTTALDGLTMSVAQGHVHGFLGPNGAGKSTTIRILLGLIKATSGTAQLLGGDPWLDAPALHRRLAYVPGDVNLWPNMSGGEAIDLLGKARGGLDKAKRDDLIARFELDPRKKGRAYSKGNRQKVALVAALSCNVELLLLDEPTSGLDPLMERTFTECIREEQSSGKTVLLSSHILSEVEALCDHVSIIKQGRIVETGTLAELRHLHATEITATFATIDAKVFNDLPVTNLTIDGTTVRFSVADHHLPEVLRAVAALNPLSLISAPPTLEELFLSQYEGAQR